MLNSPLEVSPLLAISVMARPERIPLSLTRTALRIQPCCAMIISVEKRDIEHGERLHAKRGPIALAVCRAVPGCRVEVWEDVVWIQEPGVTEPALLCLPHHAQDWLRAFDAGNEVSPFTFDLDYEAPEVRPGVAVARPRVRASVKTAARKKNRPDNC